MASTGANGVSAEALVTVAESSSRVDEKDCPMRPRIPL